jgi:hypothetical protein
MLDVRERSFYDSEALREQVGPPKLAALSAFVNKTLTAKEKALAEEIGHDFRDEFGRLNDIFANEFNRVMKQVGAYVPMIRQDVIASGSAHENQQGAEFLNVAGYSLRRNTEKGFSIERIKTGAKHQTAIKLDMFGSWMAAVERQEHFAAYYPYIRKLNGVYKTRSEGSAVVQDQISRIYGTETLNRVKAKINALANPQSFRDDTNINNLLRLLRGNVAVASLAFNLPSVLKQFAASPMPFLAHVNALEYAGRAVEFIRNPKEFSDRVRGKSAIMRHRSGSVMLEEFRRAQETNRGKKGLSVIQKIGMKGLEIADWTSVVIGWDAVYQKALAGGLSEEEAVEKADNITLKTQPSGREQDLPDLFVNQPEAMKIITQFTTSLSSIWGQLTYDLPAAVRNRQWGYVLSMVFAYALAGWGIGAVTEAAKVLIYGKDEDDEDAWKRIFLYGSFSQALDSVPLLGGEISAIAEQAITGKKRRMYTSPLMPAAESLIEAAAKATSGDWNKAAQNLAEAAAFGFGGPVSAS